MNDGKNQQILIIDDDPVMLELFSQVLSDHGYEVDTAEDGEDGIKKIDANQYNLILTDIRMPKATGIQVSKHIKKAKNNPIPVVGMSGTPWLAENNVFDAFMSKPFLGKELLQVIRNLI
jgi:CheY-like chemotaxis protein